MRNQSRERMPDQLQQRMLIRQVQPHEIEAVTRLCQEHALYEKADFSPEGQTDRLREAVFATTPRLWCFVVEVGEKIVAYATCTKDFSTWKAAYFLHMDCLYIVPEYRNLGLGVAVMRTIARHAESLGCGHIEWQTPSWNDDAARFYERLGAQSKQKLRFCWTPNLEKLN